MVLLLVFILQLHLGLAESEEFSWKQESKNSVCSNEGRVVNSLVVDSIANCKQICQLDEFCYHINVRPGKKDGEIHCDLRAEGCICKDLRAHTGAHTYSLIRRDPKMVPIQGNIACSGQLPHDSDFVGKMNSFDCWKLCLKKNCNAVSIDYASGKIENAKCKVYDGSSAKCGTLGKVDIKTISFKAHDPNSGLKQPSAMCTGATTIITTTTIATTTTTATNRGGNNAVTSTTARGATSRSPPREEKTIALAGDYDKVVGSKKAKFLQECTAKLRDVECYDVRSGSVLVSLRGSRSALDAAAKDVRDTGLDLPSFDALAAIKTTPAGASRPTAASKRPPGPSHPKPKPNPIKGPNPKSKPKSKPNPKSKPKDRSATAP